ncbi:MAG: hypothetical protein K0S58_1049 [Nitrospira sp.]|jgi:hypothetical protein|nr:hypothetical protein [Nitrospira sp.]
MQPRYSRRVMVECSAMFAGESVVAEGRVLDLSLPGCLLESREKMSAGEYVKLRLFLPDDQAPLQVPLAAVRWVQGVRIGLEFIRTSEREQRRLDRFVRRRLELIGESSCRQNAVIRAMRS